MLFLPGAEEFPGNARDRNAAWSSLPGLLLGLCFLRRAPPEDDYWAESMIELTHYGVFLGSCSEPLHRPNIIGTSLSPGGRDAFHRTFLHRLLAGMLPGHYRSLGRGKRVFLHNGRNPGFGVQPSVLCRPTFVRTDCGQTVSAVVDAARLIDRRRWRRPNGDVEQRNPFVSVCDDSGRRRRRISSRGCSAGPRSFNWKTYDHDELFLDRGSAGFCMWTGLYF